MVQRKRVSFRRPEFRKRRETDVKANKKDQLENLHRIHTITNEGYRKLHPRNGQRSLAYIKKRLIATSKKPLIWKNAKKKLLFPPLPPLLSGSGAWKGKMKRFSELKYYGVGLGVLSVMRCRYLFFGSFWLNDRRG
ncbi:hypothetical protein AKJ39_04145 [candidate division MSBL1 archaeon SCGC-AAA259J03]|uniref:Uncharacterized protein n=1 Tax=candidate division MSBL1 archaeon SCGC-AAA259J03 TaxID=1698269 RepID=A0A656YV79_9EURY|nr:hypothetical protein AKJ39_04145 [candidate division MSBL1 archaeon SCGC-AAA259J03]